MKIKTPLKVLQGANDPRVNKRNSDEIVIAVRDHGLPVEYLVAPDEGHGCARPDEQSGDGGGHGAFYAKYLDARAQESMPPPVSTHLKEITVDPKTVRKAAKVDLLSSVAYTGTRADARRSKFKATLTAGGQTKSLDSSSEAKDQAQ